MDKSSSPTSSFRSLVRLVSRLTLLSTLCVSLITIVDISNLIGLIVGIKRLSGFRQAWPRLNRPPPRQRQQTGRPYQQHPRLHFSETAEYLIGLPFRIRVLLFHPASPCRGQSACPAAGRVLIRITWPSVPSSRALPLAVISINPVSSLSTSPSAKALDAKDWRRRRLKPLGSKSPYRRK